MGQVVVVCSGKGGTGKTSFCANVAVSLCAEGERVLLVDADAGLRSLDIVLGMTDSLLFSYFDVLQGSVDIKEAAVRHSLVKNLSVITAPQSIPDYRFLQGTLDPFLNRARSIYTWTIIDCSAGLGEDMLTFGQKADEVVIVATPDETALRSAQGTSIALIKQGQNNTRIAVNRVRRQMIKKGYSVNIDKAMDTAGLSLLGVIPEDSQVIACGNKGQVLLLYSDSPAVRAYYNIARRMQGRRVKLLEGVTGRY